MMNYGCRTKTFLDSHSMFKNSVSSLPHENVVMLDDPKSGLKGIIAIHSTALGPAAGGCRLWHYSSSQGAMMDALRLSEGMSYKNALAGLPYGGGKAVLQMPTGHFDRRLLFEAFGVAVEQLNGGYVTAEDVGSTLADMAHARLHSRHVAGLLQKGNQAGGDPSPWTALGVLETIRACVRHKLGKDLSGVKIAVQGVGNVGHHLCRLLAAEGAVLTIADVNDVAVGELARSIGATVISCDKIITSDVDVFAPCALGGILNETSIAYLRAGIVVGGANNQLATNADGQRLADRDILYAPDYVVNAGGIINVIAEYEGETTASVDHRVRQISERVMNIVQVAELGNLATNAVADRMAKQVISQACIKTQTACSA